MAAATDLLGDAMPRSATTSAASTGAGAPAAPPAPLLPGLPLLGSALDLRRDFLGTMLRAQATGADVVRIDAGPPGWRTTLHVVFSPDGVEQVLGRPDEYLRRTPAYGELRETIGNGLLTTDGEVWHAQRRMVAPAFTRRRLTTDYAAAIGREAAALVERWAPAAARGRAVDAHAEGLAVAARVVGAVLFGTDVGDALPRLVRIGPFVNALLLRRSFTPHPPPRWLPTPANRRLAAAVAEMRDIVDGIVAQRAAETAPVRADRRRGNLLDLLLAAGSDARHGEGHAGGHDGGHDGGPDDGHDARQAPLTPTEIADQVLVFLLAGHETTGTTLAFALFELARRPHWQEVLRKEVDTVVGDRPVTADDVPALVQVDHVVRETLRLYPAAHTIGRRAPADGDVVLGHRIPPGAPVVVSPWAMQRSPALWPDPSRFDPDRFDTSQPGGARYAWSPFGAGPHACIGAPLAMLEATMVLATVVRAYRLHTDLGEIPLRAGITLRPASAVLVRPVPR